MGRGGGCIMKEVGGVLPGDFTQKFIDSVPGAAYLKFTLRANGNSVPPEQILDPNEERAGCCWTGKMKSFAKHFFLFSLQPDTEAHLKSLVYYRHAFSQAL